MFKYDFLLKKYSIVHNFNKNIIVGHYVSLELYDDKKIEFDVNVSDIRVAFSMIDEKLKEYFYDQRIMKINKIMNNHDIL